MHIPVLKEEVLKYLHPKKNENIIDATIDGLGHAKEIVKFIKPEGKIIGFEWTPEVYEIAQKIIEQENLKDNIKVVLENFANMENVVKEENFKNIKGVLFDLGYSNYHIEFIKRGFSFKYREQPLDMRYNPEKQILKASDIVNNYSVVELARIFREYGEERGAFKIAKYIVENRKKKIKTVGEFLEVLEKCVRRKSNIHFATKIFQALRIEVNRELENLEEGLEGALNILESGGRLVVISFHSLEDRIVKNFLKKAQKNNLAKILTKKPIVPSKKEVLENPKSRSAKLRALEKI